MEETGSDQGKVTCGSWIRRPEKVNLVVLAKSMRGNGHNTPSFLVDIFSFDPKSLSLSSTPLARFMFEEGEGDPVAIAVHPNGESIVCSTTTGGCKLFELHGGEDNFKLGIRDIPPLKSVGPQKCLAFSLDGARFAAGGADGRLCILEWPSLRIILDEPRAHKSFRDMDFSLDSEFLVSTSNDGSARIWKTEDGVPLTTLTRNSDEKFELCCFSKDGTKPFLFCTAIRGDKAVISVFDISTWNKIGYKRLFKKPVSIMSTSLDGKYLALGSKDGDLCVVEVKKMTVSHWSKRLHPGTSFTSLEFCPADRVVLTTSGEWGALVTKLNVPADWKEWQIYLMLLGLFLFSLAAFYLFFENSDWFWKLPPKQHQAAKPKIPTILGDPKKIDEHNVWGPLEL